MKNTAIPKEIVDIVETLEKSGFEAYLVGGCVRDIFLGRNPKDWDVTTNANPDQIQALFTKTVYENTFGTVVIVNENVEDTTLRNVEVTPYRVEMGYSDRRRPDNVQFSDKIEDDLKRRDFTINAVAVNLSKGAIKDIVDLYGGFQDIRDKTIRTVGKPEDRFGEDALRIMRAIRLSTELDFNIENETKKAIQSHSLLIKDIAIERVRDEFVKLIMSPNPMRGMEMLHEMGILKHFIPELEESIGVTQNQAHAFTVWEHLLRSLQHAADKGWDLEIRLSALFHDISKPKTKNFSHETQQPTFYGHEVIGSRETRKILDRMKFSRVTIEKVVKMVRWHMFFSDTETITLSAVRRMIVNVGKENIWDLMNLRICDRIGTGRPKEDPYRLRKYHSMIEEAMHDPISVGMLKVDGKTLKDELGIIPGPRMGHILHALLEDVLEDPKLNTKEILVAKISELNKLSDADLKNLGEKGREKKSEEEEKSVKEIRSKHHVR